MLRPLLTPAVARHRLADMVEKTLKEAERDGDVAWKDDWRAEYGQFKASSRLSFRQTAVRRANKAILPPVSAGVFTTVRALQNLAEWLRSARRINIADGSPLDFPSAPSVASAVAAELQRAGFAVGVAERVHRRVHALRVAVARQRLHHGAAR